MKSLLSFRRRWAQPLVFVATLITGGLSGLYLPGAYADPYATPSTSSSTTPSNSSSTKPMDSMAPTSAGAKPSGKAWDLFTKLDTNHDSSLSREEVQPLPAIANKFDSLDKGGKGYLNYDEFKSGLKDEPNRAK